MMVENNTFVVYVTKYVLNHGIRRCVVHPTHTDKMVSDVVTLSLYHGEGRDWHKTYESALKRAEDIKRRKIVLLKKQLERLEKLTFS